MIGMRQRRFQSMALTPKPKSDSLIEVHHIGLSQMSIAQQICQVNRAKALLILACAHLKSSQKRSNCHQQHHRRTGSTLGHHATRSNPLHRPNRPRILLHSRTINSWSSTKRRRTSQPGATYRRPFTHTKITWKCLCRTKNCRSSQKELIEPFKRICTFWPCHKEG